MKKIYSTPAITVVTLSTNNLLDGTSAQGTDIKGDAGSGWQGFGKGNNMVWDEED